MSQSSKGLVPFLFLSIFFLGLINVNALTAPANTTIAPYFGVSVGRMGALSTALFLPFVVVAPISGYLAELLGRKRLILHGGAILAVGLLLFGYCRSLALGEVTHLIIGTGGAAVEVVAVATIADLCRSNPASTLNLSQVFFGVGALLSPALVAHLLERSEALWPAIYFAAAIGAVLLTFGLLSQTFPPPDDSSVVPQ